MWLTEPSTLRVSFFSTAADVCVAHGHPRSYFLSVATGEQYLCAVSFDVLRWHIFKWPSCRNEQCEYAFTFVQRTPSDAISALHSSPYHTVTLSSHHQRLVWICSTRCDGRVRRRRVPPRVRLFSCAYQRFSAIYCSGTE